MLIIEKYNMEDYTSILEIQKNNMEWYTLKHFWSPWTEERFKERYDYLLDQWFIYSLRINSDIIWFFMLITDEDNYLHIKELQIKWLYQWKWFGKQCLEYIESIWKRIWANGQRLTVFCDNPAKKLYEMCWFNIVSTRFEWKAYYMEKLIK